MPEPGMAHSKAQMNHGHDMDLNVNHQCHKVPVLVAQTQMDQGWVKGHQDSNTNENNPKLS